MNVSNCRNCGRLFNVLSNERLCPQCKQKVEDVFQKVKQYLEENPNSSVNQVAEANEVSVKQIKQWVREERLTFSADSMQGIDCENCGRMIRTGRFCDSCKSNLANTLKSMLDKPKSNEPEITITRGQKGKDRMRFLDK